MITLYIICVIVSIAMCFWYFLVDVRISIVQNIMLLVMTLANLGYLSLALQTDLSGAIISCKIYYLGACFIPMLYFLTVCEMCNIHLKTYITVILSFIQVVLYGFVCSIGYSTLFYTDASIKIINGVCILNRQYGTFHFLYPVTLYAYALASLVIAIKEQGNKKNVIHKGLLALVIFEGLAVSSYTLGRIVDIPYDFTPVVFIVLMTSSLIPIYLSDIFAVVENEEVIDEQLNKIGFISFDRRMNYMGANEYALSIFKCLENQKLLEKLENPPVELVPVINDVDRFIAENKNQKNHQHESSSRLKVNDRTFETEIHTLSSFRHRLAGVTVELKDVTDHVRVLELTEQYNEELNREVELKTEKIRSIQEKTILGMAQMVESRDLSTGGHIKRTSDVVRIFSKKLLAADMGFSQRFLSLVIRSAPMHDLGKIGVEDVILRKQSKFTDEEYEIMKTHSQIGSEIVKKVLTDIEEPDFVQIADNVAHYHHEKMNGKGYPCGLKGEEIPVEARIMALADVFDALVSKRCYKEAFSYEKAFSIIKKESGSHFDEKLVNVFLTCRDELENYYDSCEH